MTITTITVPTSTLSSAANVSSTTVAASSALSTIGGILAFAGPLISSFFPSTSNLIAEIASTIPGLAVAAAAFVHALHLSASATQLTDAIIASISAGSTVVTSGLSGTASS